MRRRALMIVVAAALAGAGVAVSRGSSRLSPRRGAIRPLPAAAAPLRRARPPHLMLLIEENRDRSEVIDSASMPYLNSLARRFAQTTAWEGIAHPSLPNYLALISGSTQGVTTDATGVSFPGVPTLGSQLSRAGVSWKAYIEGLPSPGSEAVEAGEYVKRHNPFAYFPSTNGPHVVPSSRFARDLAANRLPAFVWYSPNLIDDGHDGTNADADRSIEHLVAPLLTSAWYREGGTIVITWDESENEPNVIPTVIVAGSGSRSTIATKGNHYGTLAAIEDLYGLPRLGRAAGATPLPLHG